MIIEASHDYALYKQVQQEWPELGHALRRFVQTPEFEEVFGQIIDGIPTWRSQRIQRTSGNIMDLFERKSVSPTAIDFLRTFLSTHINDISIRLPTIDIVSRKFEEGLRLLWILRSLLHGLTHLLLEESSVQSTFQYQHFVSQRCQPGDVAQETSWWVEHMIFGGRLFFVTSSNTEVIEVVTSRSRELPYQIRDSQLYVLSRLFLTSSSIPIESEQIAETFRKDQMVPHLQPGDPLVQGILRKTKLLSLTSARCGRIDDDDLSRFDKLDIEVWAKQLYDYHLDKFAGKEQRAKLFPILWKDCGLEWRLRYPYLHGIKATDLYGLLQSQKDLSKTQETPALDPGQVERLENVCDDLTKDLFALPAGEAVTVFIPVISDELNLKPVTDVIEQRLTKCLQENYARLRGHQAGYTGYEDEDSPWLSRWSRVLLSKHLSEMLQRQDDAE